jgi:hypothetical protein
MHCTPHAFDWFTQAFMELNAVQHLSPFDAHLLTLPHCIQSHSFLTQLVYIFWCHIYKVLLSCKHEGKFILTVKNQPHQLLDYHLEPKYSETF